MDRKELHTIYTGGKYNYRDHVLAASQSKRFIPYALQASRSPQLGRGVQAFTSSLRAYVQEYLRSGYDAERLSAS